MQTRKAIKTKPLGRLAEITRAASVDIDEDDRSVEISFSSEAPVMRWFGEEILDHSAGSVRMEWIGGGRAPLLLDHDRDNQIGVVESARLENGVARAVVRFGRSAKAEEILNDVRDGIRSAVSVGYRIHEMLLVKESDDGDVYRATDWEPLEVSIVSIPADREVGVGRGDDEIETVIKGETIMTDKTKEAAPAAVDQRAADDQGRREDKPRPAAEQVRETDFSARNREVAEILAVAKRFDLHEKAAEYIAEGKSLEAFNRYALDQIGQRNMNAARQKPAEVDMTPKERGQYSLMRAVEAFVAKDWGKAGLEREMSDEIAKRVGKDPNGFFVPDNIGWPTRSAGQRDLTVGSAAAGGNLVGTDHKAEDFVEALRERLVLTQMGVRLIDGLVGDVDIPAEDATTNTYHVAEGGSPTEGAPTFRQIAMSPKTIAAFVNMSRKLRKQSAPSIEALIRDQLMKSVAVGMQRVWINGGGTNEPTGILQTNGIGDVAIGTNGGPITWGTVVNLEKEVEIDDAADGTVHYLTNARVKAAMKQTPKQGSGVEGNFIMPDSVEATLNGQPIRFTNGVPNDLTKGTSSDVCSALIFGDFSSLMVGMWGGLDLMPDPYTFSASGGLRLTIFQDYDVAVRHAQSFAACQDITTA